MISEMKKSLDGLGRIMSTAEIISKLKDRSIETTQTKTEIEKWGGGIKQDI